MRKIYPLVIILTFAIAMPVAAAADSPDDILIICNKSVPQTSITPGELKDIFLKKRTNWSSGDKAIPIHAKAGTALRDRFRDTIMSMGANEEKSYWQNKKIKAGISKPVEFSNTLKATFKLRWSISYVLRSQYREGVVKVLLVLPAN